MIAERVETLILKNLLTNEDFTRRVIPFLKPDYFSEQSEKLVFEKIGSFIETYNNVPTRESLIIDCNNDKGIPSHVYDKVIDTVKLLEQKEKPDFEWLLKQTEKFCQDKAIYNAVISSVDILHDTTGKKVRGVIPQILQDALSISFDPRIGHNYMLDSDQRFEIRRRVEERIAFDLKYFNKITKGGTPKGTLNIILAGVHVGKSLAMCHMAAANLLDGKNVLYLTLEMSEEQVGERIDANLLNIALDDLYTIPKDVWDRKIETLKSKVTGTLIVKQYPTSGANVNHFRSFLQELRLKKSFVPDIIYVDYLNIASSSRLPPSAAQSQYIWVKSIAEELRGLAVEQNIPIWSATQLNRVGFQSSDPGMEDVAESFGLPATADFMISLVTTEDLEKMGQMLVKQLKNRYNGTTQYKRFLIGVDRSKMRLFDINESEQSKISDAGTTKEEKEDDVPAFDKTSFGEGMKAESSYNKDKFSKFQF